MTRERKQPVGEGCSTLRAVDGRVHQLAQIGFATLHAPREQVERRDNDGEHVVEVVRQPSGELADGVHLLRLAHLRLDALTMQNFLNELAVGGFEGRC